MASKNKKTQASLKRQMTLCRKTNTRVNGKNAQFPIVTLTGKWFQEAGFKIGHVIDILPQSGKLIITIAKEQRFELKE